MANAFYFYFRISIYFYNFYSLLFVLFVSLFVCCNFVILGKLFIDWSKNKLQRAALGRGRRRQRHNLLCFVFYLLFILNWIVSFTFFIVSCIFCILYLVYRARKGGTKRERSSVCCVFGRACVLERTKRAAGAMRTANCENCEEAALRTRTNVLTDTLRRWRSRCRCCCYGSTRLDTHTDTANDATVATVSIGIGIAPVRVYLCVCVCRRVRKCSEDCRMNLAHTHTRRGRERTQHTHTRSVSALWVGMKKLRRRQRQRRTHTHTHSNTHAAACACISAADFCFV